MDVASRSARLRVLRISHSAVVESSRCRERAMRGLGHDVELIAPRRWNEGGADVALGDAEGWVTPCRTVGRHPYVFLYDPVPIVRSLLRNRFDVIDVHEEPTSLAALEIRLLAWIAHHRRTPMVMYGAQNIDKRYPWPFRRIERGSLRRIAAIYPCNAEAGEIFTRRGFRGPVRVLPLGVPTADIAAAPVRDLDDGPVTIGYVGRLEEHKGVHVLLRALADLPDRFRLRLIGDGSHRADLERLARDLDIADRAEFVGFLPQAEVSRAYADFAVLAVPSQSRPNWVEQFGRVVVEAMAAGVPMVVADSGALPEVAGGVARVVPEADHAAWSEAILALADDPAERRSRRDLGLDRAKGFDWETVASLHADLYRDVVGR